MCLIRRGFASKQEVVNSISCSDLTLHCKMGDTNAAVDLTGVVIVHITDYNTGPPTAPSPSSKVGDYTANFTSFDPPLSSYSISQQPAAGSATISGQSIKYNPAKVGTYTLSYTATLKSGGNVTVAANGGPPTNATILFDGKYNESIYYNPWTTKTCSCQVVITVDPLPAPTCTDVNASIVENTSKRIDLSPYINGWITSGSSLKITTKPTNGTTAISGESITYSPAQKFIGSDTLQYTVTNAGGTSSPCQQPRPEGPDGYALMAYPSSWLDPQWDQYSSF